MKIRVEHAAFREPFDHAQLLNPEQNQSRPDVIEKLNCHEQNPERNFVSFRSARKSNAVMSDKHLVDTVAALSERRMRLCCLRRFGGRRPPLQIFEPNCRTFVSNANARRFIETALKTVCYCRSKCGRSAFPHEASSCALHVPALPRFDFTRFCCGSN